MILRIIGAILFVIAFNMTAMLVMTSLVPLAGLAWVLFLSAAFYGWSIRPGRGRRRRLARLRVRRPDASPRWILLSCAATLLMLFGITSFINILAPEIDPTDIPEWYQRLQPYRETVIGRAALAGLIAFAIPMVEEFSFRGHIQRTLEHRFGVPAAIGVTSVLFMVLHLGGPHWSILGVSLTLGIACGMAVHAFRSIWPPVLLHCMWNGSMLAAESLGPDALTYPEPGTLVLAGSGVLLTALGVYGWRRVLERAQVSPPGSEYGLSTLP